MMVFNHTKHKELWQWLADNPKSCKSEWPGWKDFPNRESNCFACNAILERKLGTHLCSERCPLFEKQCYEGEYKEYIKARHKKDWEAVSMIAKKIRDMPVKEDWNGTII